MPQVYDDKIINAIVALRLFDDIVIGNLTMENEMINCPKCKKGELFCTHFSAQGKGNLDVANIFCDKCPTRYMVTEDVWLGSKQWEQSQWDNQFGESCSV
jgi:hypothetical protein